MAQIERISDENADAVADIVFIHGLWGDATETWEFVDPQFGDYKKFWPRDLAEDCPETTVWSVGYDSSPTKWIGHNMPLLDRANSLLDLLDSYEIGSRPLVFITHSLGGLLAKAILRTRQTHQQNQTKPTCIGIPRASSSSRLHTRVPASPTWDDASLAAEQPKC